MNAPLDAAFILDKYEVELPSPLGQIVDQIGAAEDDEAGRLAWLFRPFQGLGWGKSDDQSNAKIFGN